MIEGSRQLPAHHITIRVPWHDDGWRGTVCENPCGNTSCTILPRVATGRDDQHETAIAGSSLEDMTREQMPPCVDEHATIMAPFALTMHKTHPYSAGAQTTHGHFTETPYSLQPYSAAAIPFRWMLREQAEGNERFGIKSRAELLKVDYQAEREPDLADNPGWDHDKKTWIQEGTNQRVMLDSFFSAARPDESLVFFYAKRTPLADDPRRVIVGVGKVKSVSSATEYRYVSGKPGPGQITGFLWEHNIQHSIRPGSSSDGFLLPYQQLLKLAETDTTVALTACTAFAPNEYFEQYSYGSELLPQDGAIASLLEIEKAIKAMRAYLDAPWDQYLKWVDRELNRLWQVRGAFPGLGAALTAFGLPNGNLLAWHLTGDLNKPIDPWPLLTAALNDPSPLPDYLQEGLGVTNKQKWVKLAPERRALLALLARFNLSNEQAKRWYQPTEREQAGIKLADKDILQNPYRLFEEDRLQAEPIAFAVIDRGMFPPESLRNEFPIQEPSRVGEPIDQRRVRAVITQTLEEAARDEGHTYLPSTWVIQRVRQRAMKPECPLDADTLPIVEEYFAPLIAAVAVQDGSQAYQLDRYVETSELIRQKIIRRHDAKPRDASHDWRTLVDTSIGNPGGGALSEDDALARTEKAAALEVIFNSRISVLMGSAGTGKSTLINALCNIPGVKAGGILLLAPTGKARVRLEQASGMASQGRTVAQFLNKLDRYNGATGRYFVNTTANRSATHKTVVIDECSMLTEEQLAALLDALENVDRLILVGDPKQLPPIGAGRPYVDIAKYLAPENIDSQFPRVAPCYAELTVTMRQRANGGGRRLDVLLADSFSGRPLDAGADEVWHEVAAGNVPFIKLVHWNQPGQLRDLLFNELKGELRLTGEDDEVGFEASLGGSPSEYNGQTHVFFNTRYKDKPGAAESAENWQILSPVRQSQVGVLALNRAIQSQFRRRFLDLTVRTGFQRRIITPPAGPEGIIYGDKVINVVNSSRRKTYPAKDDCYIANGDIGIVTGHRRTKKKAWKPTELEVELATQPGFVYKYRPYEFDGQESSPPLELAYALTVHKTQGSEFSTTFVVLPNPCRLLSREMLYTALTRHRDRTVILHQGDFRDLRQFSEEHASVVARRLTNLFIPSKPVELAAQNQSVFLDDNLIYRTEKGHLVRSKSELIIADKLYLAGINYQYERPVDIGGRERYPDFTYVDDDRGITWYWEHNGMMSQIEYRQRWERKLQAYIGAGIKPIEQGGGPNGVLLVTEEQAGVGLDLKQVKKYVSILKGDESYSDS